MDNQIESEILELNARRDRKLRHGLSIPSERREGLRGVVLRLGEKRRRRAARLASAWQYVVHLFARIEGRAGIRVAAACAVLIASACVWLGWFATGGAPVISHSTATGARSGADERVAAGGRESTFSLRIGAAQLTQLQTGLLAQHRAFSSDVMDDVTLAHIALDGIRLDASIELAP